MSKALSNAVRPHSDAAWLAVLRFVLVAGCASAVIMARNPLPLELFAPGM